MSMGTSNGNFSKRESDSIGETNGEHVEFKALYPWERPFQHRKVWGCEIESDKKTADVTTYVGNHDFDQQRLRLNHQMGGVSYHGESPSHHRFQY